jgi:hypothetical protein
MHPTRFLRSLSQGLALDRWLRWIAATRVFLDARPPEKGSATLELIVSHDVIPATRTCQGSDGGTLAARNAQSTGASRSVRSIRAAADNHRHAALPGDHDRRLLLRCRCARR